MSCRCLFRVIRDRVEPAVSPAMSVVPPKAEVDLANLAPSLKSRREDPREHAAVFSVQHLFCSIRGNAILNSHSDLFGASSLTDRGGGFSKQSILSNPARPAERECSAGLFRNQPVTVKAKVN